VLLVSDTLDALLACLAIQRADPGASDEIFRL
jgi:hypothetical protein